MMARIKMRGKGIPKLKMSLSYSAILNLDIILLRWADRRQEDRVKKEGEIKDFFREKKEEEMRSRALLHRAFLPPLK